MSSIGNSAIAASVAQGAHQQGQVARGQDAPRNHAVRQSQALKQASEKHLETVEDLGGVSDENAILEDRGRHEHEQGKRRSRKPVSTAREAIDGEGAGRVDVTA